MADVMILDKKVVPVAFKVTADEDAQPAPGHAIPLARWLALSDAGQDMSETGVILSGDTDPMPLKGHLPTLAFVAIQFPKFADGRGYSHARRLRALWKFQGPIVAFGDVLRDQLHYMARSGINGFLLRPDQDPEACLAAFSLYSSPYQYG
jgi:uncharacterized protein (DUF934 family)